MTQKCESPDVQDAPSAPCLRGKSSQGKADPKQPRN